MTMAANHIAAAEEIATRIIDDFTITDKFPSKDGAPRLSKEFDSKPELGPVWVLLNYTGEVIDPSKDGLTAFTVMPEGVKVSLMNSFTLFQARHMNPYKLDMDRTLTVSGKTKILSQSDIKSLMTPEEYVKYRAAAKAELQKVENWRQLIVKKSFVLTAKDYGLIDIWTQNIENMRPISLQVIVGQGSIPDDLNQYIEARNGSWFYRYRQFFYIVGAILLMGFLARRYLAKA